MGRYFAPGTCPDCASPLPPKSVRCPACGLVLVGPAAGELRTTLQRADALLDGLRAPITVPGAAPVPAAPTEPAPSRRVTLPAVSVPVILSGLGALCLVVAAIVFVAVTWSDLSLGARTAILVGVTAIAGVVTAVALSRGLRVAAESLSVLTVALVLIDVVAGRATSAPLLGRIPADQVDWLAGTTLLLAGLAWAVIGRSSPLRVLYGVQILAVLGGVVVCAALVPELPIDESWTAALLVVPLAGAAGLAVRHRLLVVAGGAALTAFGGWAVVALDGLWHALEHPGPAELWLGGEGVRLLVAAAFAVPVAAWRLPAAFSPARTVSATVGLGLPLLVALLPVYDGQLSTDLAVAVLSLVTLLLIAGSLVLARPWSAASAVLSVLVVAMPAWLSLTSLAAGAQRIGLGLDPPWSLAFDETLPTSALLDGEITWSMVLAGAVIGLLVDLGRSASKLSVPGATAVGVAVGAVGAVLATSWSVGVVGGLLTLAAGAVLLTSGRASVERRVIGGGLLSAVALAVAAMSRDASAVWFAANGVLLAGFGLWIRRPLLSGLFAGSGVAAGLVGALAIAEVAGIGPLGSGLLLVGLAAVTALTVQAAPEAVRRVRTGVELAAVAGTVAGLTMLDDLSWLAIGLTLAGVATVAIGLLADGRVPARWLGGALLAAATWARLFDLGAEMVELYTVPSALVLVLVGMHRLRLDRSASSWSGLAPGLGLAVLPSLLVAVEEPTSARALIVGLVGLALVWSGVQLWLGAPLVLGAVTVAVIAFVNVAPYAHAVPRWALIGAAGVALVGCGITWESRLRDITTMRAYMTALH